MIRRFFSKNKKYVRQFSGKITFWIFPPMSDLQIDCPISGVVAAWLSLSFQSFLRFPPRSAGLIVFLKPSLSVPTSRLLFSHTRLFSVRKLLICHSYISKSILPYREKRRWDPPSLPFTFNARCESSKKKKTDDPSFVYNKMSTIRRVGYNQPSQTYHV